MLNGKIVVVTGGAGLLGSSFCAAIARNRARVIVADLNLSEAERVAEKLNMTGGSADAVALDITSKDAIDELITEFSGRFGHIDAVVNNAYPRNRNYGRKLEDVAYADFCENLSLHLGGYFLVTQRFSIYLAANGGGSIVNMGSIYGVMAPRFELYDGTVMTTPVEYAAIKSAIIHLTRYFAQYYKRHGVRVNALSPGGIRDGQNEEFLKRYDSHCGGKGMLDTKDVEGALIFLLSDLSQHMTGQNLVVDDGFSL